MMDHHLQHQQHHNHHSVAMIGPLFITITILLTSAGTDKTQGRDYWFQEARRLLKRKLEGVVEPHPMARNVVFLVGDGLGLSTLTAARILKGQRLGQLGEDHLLAWDEFPAVALAKTYNLDSQVGESSACATALLCGVKARKETVGLHSGGKFLNCSSSLHSRVESLLDWAQQQRKSTGIVTTSRVTHATPAALYSHAASRYWEDDSRVPPPARRSCKDIARQIVEDEPGRHLNVLLGGGRRHWLPRIAKDPELLMESGRRQDGRDLTQDWLREKKRMGLKAEYVWNKEQLDRVDPNNVDHLLGLFSYSHMEFEVDRDPSPQGNPSLAEMTRKALHMIMNNPRGFFLFIESGRIDHGHHYNNAYRALDETLVLESALLVVMSLVNLSDTLIVLTSDHSNVMTFGGMSTPRGNPILGTDSQVSDVDGIPYSTLLYGAGPGYTAPRATPLNGSSQQALHEAAVPRQWSTHGGEDVPVFARGPLAKALFSGTIDQTFVPHAIAYIACLGEHVERCENLNVSAFAYRPNCAVPGSAFVLASSKYNKNLLQDAENSSSFVQLYTVMNILIVCTVFVF
ncbi:hypothetical protein LSTR_LSTR010652 [Laodelphax striatellus]|uniref:alkaline phosphatase n=1 Tax=Laodelphax striatellus TaxID=195883 RepID=A0A482XPP4_LAOST|nr:hypothetical protein LSTR_LSTR010652 [Laodelphax striatellus]